MLLERKSGAEIPIALANVDCRLVDPYIMARLTPEALAGGEIFSTHFLKGHLESLTQFDCYTREDPYEWEDILLRKAGILVWGRHSLVRELLDNWWRVLGKSGKKPSQEEETGQSPKVSSHHQIAQRLKLEGAVLFTGKLEGTISHMGAVNYLSKYAPVILGVEPWQYYVWTKHLVDPSARVLPLIFDTARVSLWAYYSRVSAVFLVPPKWHQGQEEASAFYDNLFAETGAAYSCAYKNDPNREEKLRRGEQPEGKDWRIIPERFGASTRKITRIWNVP